MAYTVTADPVGSTWNASWITCILQVDRLGTGNLLTHVEQNVKEENVKMERIKKLLAIVMCVAMLLCCAACGAKEETPAAKEETKTETPAEETPAEETPTADEKIVIAGTLQDMSNEFMVMLKDAMDATLPEYDNVELNILDGEGSPDKQVSQIENFIAQEVDAIILCPQDGTALVPAVKQALEAGIPVITVSADIDQQVGQVNVGSNHKDAGIMQAEWAAEQLGGKGKIVYLRGPIGHFAEVQRAEGTLEVFEKYPDIEIVFDQTGNWDRDQGMSLMENALQGQPEIDMVMSQNDEMVLGAITALEGAGKNDAIISIGMDAIPDALKAIEEGRLDATIFQDAFGQGSGALRVAIKAAQGEAVETVVIPWAVVDASNVADYK